MKSAAVKTRAKIEADVDLHLQIQAILKAEENGNRDPTGDLEVEVLIGPGTSIRGAGDLVAEAPHTSHQNPNLNVLILETGIETGTTEQNLVQGLETDTDHEDRGLDRKITLKNM